MIKILHTADWHIGKVLHKHSLREEMMAFFDWLLELIKTEHINVLLISGDVFDLANPAAKDRKDYYQFLSRLLPLNVQVIVTGGNHDGVGVINAPRELLNSLNISVIGGAIEKIEEEIVRIKDKDDKVKAVVAAVPFLRDRDLRNLNQEHQYKSRIDTIREGIKSHYHQLGEICNKKYKNVPAIAMGHLYAKGVTTSESERDIHIGNAAAVDSEVFSDLFSYVALGHIHRPQVIGKNEMMRYSGSPIPLSFSEREDQKGVLLVEVNSGQISAPKFIEIPKKRELKRLKGDYKTIQKNLNTYKSELPLPAFVELLFIEENFNSTVLAEIEDLVSQYSDHPSFKILKSKTEFNTGAKDTADLFQEGEHIEDLDPKDVFIKRLEIEELDQEKSKLLIAAFAELMEEVEREEV